MDIKQLAQEFVISYFGVREDFFNTAWDFINTNYSKIHDSVVSAKGKLDQADIPLAFVGKTEGQAVKAILIFTTGFKEVNLTGDIAESVLASVQSACKQYRAEARLKEEILQAVKSGKEEIINFFKEEQRIKELKPKEKEKKLEINFTETEVLISGQKPLSKDTPLILAEYIILKEKVHWLWSFVILPKFETRKPKWQFRNYISKKRGLLKTNGIKITALKKREDDYAKLEGIEDKVKSNIQDVKDCYNQAIFIFNEGKFKDAVKELSKITASYYKWYSFSDVYMKLTEWIRISNFEGISEKLIADCRDFFSWYRKRLQVGTSRIEFYKKQLLKNKNKLDELAEQEFQKIKEESGKVEENLQALVERVPLSKEDEEYENFVRFLIDAQDKLRYIWEKESETEEVRQETSIKTIIWLQKENKYFDEVIKKAFDIFGNELYQLNRSKTYSDKILHDESREVYWFIYELILNLKSFDEFELKKGNKLGMLLRYFERGLENKIKNWLNISLK